MHEDSQYTCVTEHSYASRTLGKIGREFVQTYQYTSTEKRTYIVAIILRMRVDM